MRALFTCLLAAIFLIPEHSAGQTQTKNQQKCTAATHKGLLKIAASLGKDICSCIQDGAKGELAGTIEVCATADRAGKVAKAISKHDEKFTKLCTELPPYGVTDAQTVELAARELAADQIHDLFGADLDTGVISLAADTAAASCQQSVAKQAKKCEAAQLKAFLACAKKGLKDEGAPFDAADDLAACIGSDPKGKVAKKCDLNEAGPDGKVDGIRKALSKKCVDQEVNLATALPGCALSDPELAHACIEADIHCRVCLALNRAGGLTRDCDTFDDGVTNQSCVAPLVIGRHQCVLTPETSGFLFETAAFFDSFLLNGALDIDCGTVDPETGRTTCACSLAQLDPVPIVPGIGVACVYPAQGCAAGEMSCNGGELFNNTITSMHNSGACSSNADCATTCATACAAQDATVLDSACEGFCRGGASNDSACTADANCPGGICNGLDGATHGNVCQCQCVDRSGDPSLPGGLHCNVGVNIEVETALPCGDGDVQFRIGDRCVPFTTETVQAAIVDANNVSDERIPSGIEIAGGLQLACDQLAANGPSGLGLVASVNVFDVQRAGDAAFIFFLGCE